MTERIEAIKAFSPTLINDLTACAYRVALLHATPGLKKPNTYSALGNAAHAITELAWKGAFDEVPSETLRTALNDAWTRLLEEEAAKLGKAIAPACPPEIQEWPGRALTRARLLDRLTVLIESRRGRDPAAPHGWIAAERKLSDPSSGLWGRLDRVERRDGRLRVVDLKSGLTQSEIKPSQRRQLLLYAVLVNRQYDEWPDEVVVETAAGVESAIAVRPAEAEAELAEAVDRVGAYNVAAMRGWTEMERAATPSLDSCRYCPARIECEPYWQASDGTWPFQGAVRGAVETVVTNGSSISLQVIADRPRDIESKRVEVFGQPPVPVPSWIAPGTEVRVVGAWQGGDGSALRFRWDTDVSFTPAGSADA